MQKHINYLDFFQFYLHIPVAIFEDITDQEVLNDCLDLEAYPLSIIRDVNHPLFVKIKKDFKTKGVKQDLKLIVLAIGYNKEYLS
jgi:hypothetical protein